MVLDVPVQLRKPQNGERAQVEIGLALDDLAAANLVDKDAGLQEEEYEDEINLKEDAAKIAEEGNLATAADREMKKHLQEMEKKLDELVKAGQQRVKRDGYKEKAVKAKLGNIAH